MRQLIALVLAALLLFGCVNISDTAKAASFGKKGKEKQAYDYFVKKYGDPSGTGAPRIIGLLVTTSVVDDMPSDVVKKYNKDVPAFYAWFFYDNFGTGDAITVTFKYLDEDTIIHTFNSKGGGDYGAGAFKLAKPDDGWPTGKYSVTVSGKGVSETYPFEVIDGPTVSEKLPYENYVPEKTTPPTAPPATPPTTAPTQTPPTPSAQTTGKDASKTSSATSDKMVFDSCNDYRGGCSLTDTAKFTLSTPIQGSLIQAWYSWGSGEKEITYALKHNGADFASGTMVRADCDPYQGQWCNGNHILVKEFPAGDYELKVSNKKMCLKPGVTGCMRIYGVNSTGQLVGGDRDAHGCIGSAGYSWCEAKQKCLRVWEESCEAATAPKANLPAGVPTHLSSCNYAGNWDTDWGTMQLKQSGSIVEGTYTWDSGKIRGTITDGVFVGKWSESPSYSEPNDGGDAIFYFTSDCNSFTGKWHYGVHASGDWSGGWVGKKKA